jgi:ArsR family metal-binding transcriptional regulator
MKIVTTFPDSREYEKTRNLLETKNVPFTIISPEPGYAFVGTKAIIIDEEHRPVFGSKDIQAGMASGWVDYNPPKYPVPATEPAGYEEDIFGKAMVMVLQPCAADAKKLRVVAHITGDLTEVFPYMNAVMNNAFYNVIGPTFTLMETHRIIALYPRRIAIAKTDDIVDTWRVLEWLRVRCNECWKNRAHLQPDHSLHKRPPALEIYYRLPKTNCKECGEKTCMAFALRLWSGETTLHKCKPVFGGTHRHLKDALVEICGGLGVQKE